MTTLYDHKTELVGDDYTGLPTKPVQYRGKPKQSSVDWDQIQADYVARGGQVDATVWPAVGKVVVITGNANSSRANLHTFVEATDDEYGEPAQRARKPRGRQRDFTRPPHRPNAKLTDEQRADIRRRRANGEILTALAAEYSVSVTTIVKTVKAGQS